MIGTVLSAGSSRLPDELDLKSDNAILLKNAQFDTTAAEPAISVSGMSISQYPADLEGYYIVQFTGYIHDEWKMAVRDTGAVIFDYVPNNAFIVRMNASVKANVEALDTVQWVGIYQPAYRISPVLSAAGSARENVTVLLFDAGDNARVSGEIKKLGGEVVESAGDRMKVRIDRSKISDVAIMNGVSWIEKYVPPVIFNDVASNITGVYTVRNTHGLNGSGQIVAVADTGLDKGVNDATMHDDIEGRIVQIYDIVGDGAADLYSGHGTHVAGSVLGNGSKSNGQYKGMAPGARLVFEALADSNDGLYLPVTFASLFQQAYDSGARIHSNSWGFIGVPGEYLTYSQDVDNFMWNNPGMLIVFSAGNDGVDSNSNGVVDQGSISPPATAKNSLAVGASENNRPTILNTYGGGWPLDFPVNPIFSDVMTDNVEGLAAFSGRGPTADGRIKPDIVAPGTFIISTRSSVATSGLWGDINAYYRYSGGTSMSTPIVAGTAALVRQYYVQNESITPSAALLKATLINGAYNMTPGQYGTGATKEIQTRPDFAQGWGRVNLTNSLFPSAPRTMRYHDNTTGLSTSRSWNTTYYVNSSSEPLRVTLVWTDYKGNPAVLNQLVNNLTLNVTTPSGSYYLGNGGDSVNNVEQVELSSPEVGSYNIKVEGTNIPQGPQPFAIVISGAISSYGAPSITGFSPSSPVTDTAGAARTFSITADQTANVTWFINGSQVQYNSSVASASYTNSSAVAGTWNVTVIANNTNGSAMNIWDWIVEDSLIDACTAISSPGNYVLNRSITNSVVPQCINISSGNVVFDGAGYTIDGQDVGNSYGVYVYNASATLTNVTVINITLTDWFAGIYYNSSWNGTIQNFTSTSNTNGVYLIYSGNNTLRNINASSNSNNGIIISSGSNNTLNNITASSHSAFYGVWLSSSANNTLTNITASSNAKGFFFESSSYNTMTDSSAFSNSYGIDLRSSSNMNILTSNTAKGSSFGDFYSDSTSINNTVTSLDINNIISFKGRDITIKSNSSPAADPGGYHNISKFVQVTNNNANAWLFLNLSYNESDINSMNESTLTMWRFSGSSWSQVNGTNGIETVQNYVYANITNFSIFAPMGVSSSIDSCTNISMPGTYTLTQNITNSTFSKCINITANDVVFDGAGYKIDGYGYSDTYGVYAYNSSISLINITVKNVTTNEWNYGIYYRNTINGTIENNTVDSNNYGIHILTSSNNSLSGNSANTNSFYGIFITLSNNNTLFNNSAKGNLDYGFYLSSSGNNTLIDNNMTDNAYNFGISGSEQMLLSNSIDTSNTVDSRPIRYLKYISDTEFNSSYSAGVIYCILCSNVTIRDLNLSKNDDAISFFKTNNSRIENVNSSSNKIGIYLSNSNDNVLINNIVNSNTFDGVLIFYSNNNSLINNIANNKDYGISVRYSSDNTLINNTANSNIMDGFYLDYSYNNSLTNNIANSNNAGFRLLYSGNNTMNNNIANSNTQYGIVLQSSINGTLANNSAKFNTEGAFYSESNSLNNTITNLNISINISFTAQVSHPKI